MSQEKVNLDELAALLALLEKHNVSGFKLGDLELQLQPTGEVVTLDELLGEGKKDSKEDPNLSPKNAYEAALERTASQ